MLHILDFVSQVSNDIHTNTIERTWRTLKSYCSAYRSREYSALSLAKFHFSINYNYELQRNIFNNLMGIIN